MPMLCTLYTAFPSYFSNRCCSISRGYVIFSPDIYTLDEQLPSSVSMYLSTVIKVLGVLVVISSVTPIFTACLIPIVVYYSIQQEFFKKTYRELKRLDSVSRSPIYALFQETLDGISTIRAFSAQSSLLERITLMLDKQQNAYFLTFSSQCWCVSFMN